MISVVDVVLKDTVSSDVNLGRAIREYHVGSPKNL